MKPQQFYSTLANLLDYPTTNLIDQTGSFITMLEPDYPESIEYVREFLDFAETTPLGRLEEIYTGTFDVNPACYIFAGYMLFGESFKRGKFLVRLQEEYRNRGFSAGNELADHTAVLFRFLGTLSDNDADQLLTQQLVRDCLGPVFKIMIDSFKPVDPEKDNLPKQVNPYSQLLRAILIVLERFVLDMPDTIKTDSVSQEKIEIPYFELSPA
jgi:nitrate reductase delta subunit